MKKLTDNWKIKKGNLREKSFRDAIDYALSNTPDAEKCKKKVLPSNSKKIQSPYKSPLTDLNVTPVTSSEGNTSTSLRRSNRLKEKSSSVRLVDKKVNYAESNVSFSFNDSFGSKMAHEASKCEKKHKPSPAAVQCTKRLKKLIKNDSEEENMDPKSENFASVSSISCQTVDNKILSCTGKNIQASSMKVGFDGNNCIEDKNKFLPAADEAKVEPAFQSHGSAGSSVDSKNQTSFGEEDCLDLAYWGLPSQVIAAYRSRKINKMFQWQYECLSMKDVLNGRNLVYSAPTSAGKTLVSELLMLKKVIESKKKAMMILPFVSVVREKVNYFQEMFQDTGIVVGGYMGAHRPPGGFKAVDIAICTIEKANNLINRLMEEKRLEELGILVVDELHMLGDNSRGYLLELLLTKLLYNCKKNNIQMQIIGMSATLPNLNVLAFWLDAELYRTDFRPVPLHEMYKVGPVIYDSATNKPVNDVGKNGIAFANDSDHTIYLAIETVASGNGVLVFCPSKNWCESLATSIAREIYNTGRPTQQEHKSTAHNYIGQKLREYINGDLLSDILLQLKNSPAGLDSVLKMTVPFGVAFHHAGLTYEERDIIESAFKQGILKVLVATTTLSSGVNLPARRVLIRSPLFCGSVIDTLSYKQMVGRAGRKGIDDQGESILLCKESERNSALQLVASELQPVKSCLMKSGKDGLHSSLKRAIIEVIASGVAITHEEVIQYASCTLLFASLMHENSEGDPPNSEVEVSINKCLDYLLDNEFIFKIEKKEDESTSISYKPSQLGTAILASGFSPEDSLRILKELQLARRSFVLENDLHILYEVTPPYLSDQMGSINWMNFLTLWEHLPEDYRRVGELVGVRESFIGLGIQGRIKMNSAQIYHKLAVHQRFYAALALNDLIQEIPLSVVSEKYNCNKGILQSLQQTTSTFSGMLTIFCNRLGWYNLELLFSHFQKRVHFGIQQELCDLIQLSTLNAQRARILYNAGYETISSLAAADPDELELVLCNAGAFESERQFDGCETEEVMKRREAKRIRITGKQGVNEKEAALLIIKESQSFIKYELGIKTITWESSEKKLPSTTNKIIDPEINHNALNDSINNKSIEQPKTNVVGDRKSSKNFIVSGNTSSSKTIASDKENSGKIHDNEPLKSGNMSDNPGGNLSINNKSKSKSQISSQNCEVLSVNSDNYVPPKSTEKVELVESSQNDAVSNLRNESVSTAVFSPCDKSHITKDNACNKKNENKSKVLNFNLDEKMSDAVSDQSEYFEESLKSADIVCDNIPGANVSKKNETYFFTDEISNLFDELEKTVLVDAENKISSPSKMTAKELHNCDNNLTFSELLLSQSADMDNVYLGESFLKSDFQNSSFSVCMSSAVNDNPQNLLSNSKIESVNSRFTSKKTRDTLDALFDSPPCENSKFVKEKQINFDNATACLQFSNIDAIFDSPNFDSATLLNENKTNNNSSSKLLNIDSKNFKMDLQGEKLITENNNELNNKSVFKSKFNSENILIQSTPKKEVVDECLQNLDLSEAACFINDFDENKSSPGNLNNLRKSGSSKKSEASGDLFEDSFSGDLLNKAQVIDIDSEKLENSVFVENNVHCISSCSDEIFNDDKSFEKILENQCVQNNDLDLMEKNSKKENFLPKPGTKISDKDSNNIFLNNKNDGKVSDVEISPNTLKQLNLENSGDIFDDDIESEPAFINPKKHLSFKFEDNSEIFKSWKCSPQKIVQLHSANKNEAVFKKSPSPKEMEHCKNSFLENVSDCSSFSSDCLEGTPPEKTHSIKSVLLQSTTSKKKKVSSQCTVPYKTNNKIVKGDYSQSKVNKQFAPSLFNLEASLPSSNRINLDIVDVLNENFDSFLQLLKDTSVFGLSVACEKAELKTTLNIGPPKFRAKSNSVHSEKIYVNGDILIVGLAFCFSEKVFFLKFPSDSEDETNNSHLSDIKVKLKSLQHLFDSFTCKIITVYDIKSYYKVLKSGCNITLSQHEDVSYLDPSIAAWLLDPSDGQQSLQELVLNYWSDASYLIEGFDRGKGSLGLQHWSSVSGQQRASTEAYVSFHVIKTLSSLLKEKKLFKSFVDVEMPSVITLAEMEQHGLGFDLKLAMEYRKELQKKQDAIVKKIYQLAGHSFNIMSSKDLSRVLYKELKLNPPDVNCSPMANKHLGLGIVTRSSTKKLPPALKTNKECLEKIVHLHPLPKAVMDWRKLSFAVSKVLMPLLRENKFDKDFQMHRLHSTCYVYTVTGRINMHTPNLQFVPRDFSIDGVSSEDSANGECFQIDDEIALYGISLRNMFVPAEGNVLLSADYSQLELRILAHLSGDVKLLKSLNTGDDIFKQIAATWKNIPILSVTDDLRQQAKKICYGIIYGMGARALAHQLKTSENDASHFMETFKKSYPGVAQYLNSVVEKCQKKGYISTIMGRRRYLPHILSENKGERAQAERQAINTTIQGSAADIIKKATIEIEKQLKNTYYKDGRYSGKCRKGGFLVLQLHDELIYEVVKNDLEVVKSIVKTVMERATKLSVILPVNIKVGSSWGSMKEIL